MTVTAAAPEHTTAIAALLEEIDRHYGAPEIEPLEVRIRQTQHALFADPPSAYALLAWDGEQLVGLAAYSFQWPAIGSSRSLYLKELYVTEAQRGTGVGSALMRALFEVAAKHECTRVEWTTDAGSIGAQRFYEKLGLSREPTKLFYRADGVTIQQWLR